MIDERTKLCGINELDYIKWCEKNNKNKYDFKTKKEFYSLVFKGNIQKDEFKNEKEKE